MKKILFVFLVLITFSIPFQQTYLEVNATVISKVASAVAKKTAKVPIKDITKEIAFEMALQAIGQSFNEKSTYKFDENYEGYCMTEIKADGSCGKVMQIKKDLTVEDMSKIDSQVDVEIDRAISGGTGLTKWQKFMDWFLPVWIVSAGTTVLTYAIDSDVRSLFNEIGYNTLVSTGLLAPVITDEPLTLDELDTEVSIVEDGIDKTLDTESMFIDYRFQTKYNYTTSEFYSPVINAPAEHLAMEIKDRTPEIVNKKNYIALREIDSSTGANKQLYGFDLAGSNFKLTDLNGYDSLTISIDGTKVWESPSDYFNTTQTQVNVPWEYAQDLPGTVKNVLVHFPYTVEDKTYTDTLLTMKDGRKFLYQLRGTKNPASETVYKAGLSLNFSYGKNSLIGVTHKNITQYEKTIVPRWDEVQDAVPKPISKYEKAGYMAMIPAIAIPLLAEDGSPVTMIPGATSDDPPTYQKEDGTVVPEDSVTVGEPIITEDSTGVPQYTPTPTPDSPTPTPVPITPTPPPAPPEEPPLSEFPEGESCQEKLKFPIFSPLKEQLSTSFPFSIPWDIERAAQAAFGGISAEKPSFTMPIVMFGDTHEVTITTPKFMDDWKPFTDSLLLITFDILIMFGLYRFVKGAGS